MLGGGPGGHATPPEMERPPPFVKDVLALQVIYFYYFIFYFLFTRDKYVVFLTRVLSSARGQVLFLISLILSVFGLSAVVFPFCYPPAIPRRGSSARWRQHIPPLPLMFLPFSFSYEKSKPDLLSRFRSFIPPPVCQHVRLTHNIIIPVVGNAASSSPTFFPLHVLARGLFRRQGATERGIKKFEASNISTQPPQKAQVCTIMGPAARRVQGRHRPERAALDPAVNVLTKRVPCARIRSTKRLVAVGRTLAPSVQDTLL